jgi:hypothetical protein
MGYLQIIHKGVLGEVMKDGARALSRDAQPENGTALDLDRPQVREAPQLYHWDGATSPSGFPVHLLRSSSNNGVKVLECRHINRVT